MEHLRNYSDKKEIKAPSENLSQCYFVHNYHTDWSGIEMAPCTMTAQTSSASFRFVFLVNTVRVELLLAVLTNRVFLLRLYRQGRDIQFSKKPKTSLLSKFLPRSSKV